MHRQIQDGWSWQRLRRPRRLPLAAALALAFSGSAALAEAPLSGLEGIGTPVADERLAEMRGKYIAPGRIAYFGVSMASSWQGANGVTTSALLLFSVDFAGGAGNPNGAKPQLVVAWNRMCDSCGDQAMDVAGFGPAASEGYVAFGAGSSALQVGGLDSVGGAVQSQQIAGADNRVVNRMQLAIVPASSVSQQGDNGLALAGGSARHVFDNGDSVSFVMDAGSIALGMEGASGNVAIRQAVTPSQLNQHVRLSGDWHQIHNSMTVTVGLNDTLTSGGPKVQHALSAMQGRGF